MALRSAVKQACYATSITPRLARRDGSSFIITVHGVLEEQAAPFATCVRFLQKNFSLVSMDEYVDAFRARRCRGLVALTFDDGLRNQLTVAYRVLRELRAPATFYVCPGLVGTSLSTWTWELEPRWSRMAPAQQQQMLARASVDSFEALLQGMKEMPLARRDVLWQEVERATPGFAFTPEEDRSFRLMDWHELAQLDRSLITIGSHTHTHVDLPQADDDRLESELATSKVMLRNRLGCDARHFAYPNGNCDERSAAVVAAHFDSAVTTEQRATNGTSRMNQLPRVHIDWDVPSFAWTLAKVPRD